MNSSNQVFRCFYPGMQYFQMVFQIENVAGLWPLPLALQPEFQFAQAGGPATIAPVESGVSTAGVAGQLAVARPYRPDWLLLVNILG